MGLNISGLVIDKNYENKITELESVIGQKLVFEKEVTFDETLESWKEDTYCDVYFSKNGTLVLLSMEVGGFDFYANNQTAFSFVLSEMTMMFTINYTKNDELIRSIMESEEMNEDEGEPFEFEKNEDDKSELIYHLIEKTLGESFHNIDLEAKCFRYSFKQETVAEETNTQSVEIENEQTNQNKKLWWKFW
ncbi:hypothetical protein [Aequorivita echinoideorum]|uniref:Uncharacterized protein n=1 Tax=Aequorivita echinoideorum TaxID=1549647 RepID=A0ABS5S7Q4_9FLAO|nr:hypothetical protein [Aequorivita echinoideorum]MBT0609241.1 hypothetical protein [Aequorivita echinoideorum]